MIESSITNHYIKVKNKRIRYIEKNGTSDVAILFVHGRAMSASFWEKQFTSENLHSFRLIALDLPGHGLSEHCADYNNSYGLSSLKEIVIEFIDKLGLQDYILVGLSFGGNVVLQALPDLQNVKGAFVMTMPVTKPMSLNLMFQNTEKINKAYGENPSDTEVNEYISLLLRPNPDFLSDIIQEALQQADPQIHVGILNGVIEGKYQDEFEIIRQSKCPVAIVVGCDDQIHDLTYLSNISVPLWRHSLQIIAKAGHLPNWENPDQVNNLLKEFVEEFLKAPATS